MAFRTDPKADLRLTAHCSHAQEYPRAARLPWISRSIELRWPLRQWLPDGYSQILMSYVIDTSGFWTMAPLRYAAKFDPVRTSPSTLAQSKGRTGSNFAIWQHSLRLPRLFLQLDLGLLSRKKSEKEESRRRRRRRLSHCQNIFKSPSL